MNLKLYGLMLAAVMTGASAMAASSYPAPDIKVVNDRSYGGALEKLSDNGKWAVGWGQSKTVDQHPIYGVVYAYPRLYNVETGENKYLFTPQEEATIGVMQAMDVTDDGQLVVGCYDGKPAIWRASTGQWEIVPNGSGHSEGRISAVTPDGKYAIGTIFWNSGMYATLRYWDLSGTTPVDITPDNLPKPIGPNINATTGMLDNLVQQLYAGDISVDGSKFTGQVNYSYPDDTWSFIYNVTTHSWEGIGMDVTESVDNQGNDVYTFSRMEGMLHMEPGKFVLGTNTLAGPSYNENDESGIYYYNLDNGEISFVEGATGYEFGAVDGEGTVFASKSYGGPIRDWLFAVGKYWYEFDVLISQLWDISFKEQVSQDEYGYTGTFTNISADGKTIIASDFSTSPYNSYVIKLPATMSQIVPEFNLLGNYYTTPVNNSSFGTLKEVRLTFDRNIEVLGAYNCVSVIDESGNPVANSISVQVDAGDSKTLVATFRNRTLETGKVYTVLFPADIVCVSGDTERKNGEVRVNYKGRPHQPVAPVTISPADNTEVSSLNASSNPISIRFDSELSAVSDQATDMKLYLIGEDGTREVISNLSGSITGDVFNVFPVLEQRLGRGQKYEVVIPANVVADLSGADPNEEIVIHYTGNYKPDNGDQEKGILFQDNFDQGLTNNWMFYDGANLEPSELMVSWGFEQGWPWWTAREDEMSTDQSAVTHSMFKSPGKADSWMVTPQLYIEDDSAVLTFKSQSYRDDEDHLKVIVYESDDVYAQLTESIVDNIRYYGELVYDEVQTPGASEELLSGDWKENVVSLDKYAGKNIYVAFWNDNRNKSAVFVDDVDISRDVKFVVSNMTSEYTVQKSESELSGLLSVMSKTESYHGYSIKAVDADDNVIAEVSDPNVDASYGWELEFTMPAKLQTPVGERTAYKYVVTMGDQTKEFEYTLSNLTHQTKKNVVIEEMTGQGCQACPLGHAALDWILKDFPENVFPIELHTYSGDSFNNARVESLCVSLGLNSAPTARINRGANIISPMADIGGGMYGYRNVETETLWYDEVVNELGTLASADVEVTSVKFENEEYVATIAVKPALNLPNQNLNLLIELCEDGVPGTQYNPRYDNEDPALGEWGKGGIYSQLEVPYNYHNVLRNWEGNTYNGTGGLIPTNLVAGEEYYATMKLRGGRAITDPYTTHITALLIDSQSGKVLNSDRRMTGTNDGVDGVLDAAATLVVNGSTLTALNPGAIEMMIYGIDGSVLASAQGLDEVSVEVGGYRGVAVVIVKTEKGIKTYKTMVR